MYTEYTREHFRRCLECTIHVCGVGLAQQTQVMYCAEYNQSVIFTVISMNEVTTIDRVPPFTLKLHFYATVWDPR